MSLSHQNHFAEKAKKEGFSVDFSPKVARVLEYRDSEGPLEFTTDSSEKGDHCITLEHHPESWPRGERYDLAFVRCRQFFESCGFGVDVWPEEPNQSPQTTRAFGPRV